ncbi:MAG: tetratricopeptide repeat protein [Planctomycetota bacterium]|nr:tetratricopeptide repeat protein [Planctomycetota bacterium]
MTAPRPALALLILATLLAAPARAQGEGPDERYGFLVGLCEEREWELAAREARAFLEAFPQHAKSELARYRLATALFELGQRDGARDLYAELERNERFEFRAECAFRRGQCELALGRAPQAASAFERVLALRAAYLAPAATFFLAEARFAQGDFAAAEQGYERTLATEGGTEYEREARYGLCWCAFRLEHHDVAVERINDWLQRFPGHANAAELHYLAGEAQLAAGRAREALAEFESVRSGPFEQRALRGAAFAAAELGDLDGAARRFARLVEREPNGPFAEEARLQRGAVLLRGGDAKGAVAALTPLAGSIDGASWLARAQLASGDANAALGTVERAVRLQLDPGQRDALAILRGDALTALGRSAEAAEAYSQAKSDYALHAAAIAAFNSNALERAEPLARRLLKEFPQSAYAAAMHMVCGEAALARGEHAAARREFAAVDVEGAEAGQRARARLRGAWSALLAKDGNAAAQLAGALVREFPSTKEAKEALFVLGRASDELGDGAAAIEAWKQYVEAEPKGAHAAEALAGLARLDTEGAARWSERLASDHGDSEAAFGALLALADREAREGRKSAAAKRYAQILERWPEHALAPRARYALAWTQFDAGQAKEASATLAPLAQEELEPELAAAVAELGLWSATRSGDVEASLAAYSKLLETPTNPRKLLEGCRAVAELLKQAQRAAEARPLFEDLLRRARGERGVQTEALVESAWLAIDAKDADEAEALARTANKLAPDDAAKAQAAEACFFAGELRFAQPDLERAKALYELALPHASATVAPQVLYKLGFVHLRGERLEEAAACFAKVAAEHATHELAGESRFLAADCRFRQRRFAECAELLATFAKDLPRHASVPNALFELGVSLGELGRWKECEATLVELARRGVQPANALEADLWRARAVAARGDERGARAALERVTAADKGRVGAQARVELGKLDSKAGKHEDALASFLKIALLYEGGELVAEANFLAAGELEALERLDKACARYSELVARHPNSPFAVRAKERLDALGR